MLTDSELQAIERRRGATARALSGEPSGAVRDVVALLAEVKRLRDENDRMRDGIYRIAHGLHELGRVHGGDFRKARGVLDLGGELPEDAIRRLRESEADERCYWREDDDGIWHGDCGVAWTFECAGTPRVNGLRYCPQCGRRIVVQVREEGDDDEAHI